MGNRLLLVTVGPGPESGATWPEAMSAISSILTFLVLLIGGLVAFSRFLRTRVLEVSCPIDLSVEVGCPDEDESKKALFITVIASNGGSHRLTFPPDTRQTLRIASLDSAMWDDAVTWGGEVLWSMGDCIEQDLLTVEGVEDRSVTLRPGQRWRRSLLVPLPEHVPLVYKIDAVVETQATWMKRNYRKPVSFSTETIISTRAARHG